MSGQLTGKNIVVTGGTQGLGRAIALEAAREGAAGVVICGRSSGNGEAARAEIEGVGSRALFVRADLQYQADCRGLCVRRRRSSRRFAVSLTPPV